MAPLLRIPALVLGSAGLVLPAAAQETPPGWRSGPMWDGHWGWMFMGPLMMIIFVAAVVVLVVVALRWIAGGGQHGAPPATRTPLDILKERFARGEIDKAEFEERRRLLQD
jgi:putative membrane protein